MGNPSLLWAQIPDLHVKGLAAGLLTLQAAGCVISQQTLQGKPRGLKLGAAVSPVWTRREEVGRHGRTLLRGTGSGCAFWV